MALLDLRKRLVQSINLVLEIHTHQLFEFLLHTHQLNSLIRARWGSLLRERTPLRTRL